MSPRPIHPGMLASLILCKSCTCSHTPTVSLCEQWYCHVQKTPFTYSCPPLLSPTFLLSPLPRQPLKLWRSSVIELSHLGLSTLKSLVLITLTRLFQSIFVGGDSYPLYSDFASVANSCQKAPPPLPAFSIAHKQTRKSES